MPVLGGRDKGHLGSLARQLRLLDSLQVRERPVSERSVVLEETHPSSDFCAHMPTFTHAHTHTCKHMHTHSCTCIPFNKKYSVI